MTDLPPTTNSNPGGSTSNGPGDLLRQLETSPDPAMSAYVGYLAAWFDLGQLVAGSRLARAGVREPLLND